MADLSNRKVAILTEEGFEQVELTSPKEALEKAGATVHVISPKSGKIKAWDKDHWGIEVNVRYEWISFLGYYTYYLLYQGIFLATRAI